jgi:hypothetical protein
MNQKPAVILLCGQPHAGRKWFTDYLFKARESTGASIECISFRQMMIQSATATIADAKNVLLLEGVNMRTIATFPLSENVRDFLEVVNRTMRTENPALFPHWVMAWIRIRYQNGCRLFIVPDLEYADDIKVFQKYDKEFNLRFVHVVAANRTAAYLKNKKLTPLEALPENVEVAEKEDNAIRRITTEIMKTEFTGLFHLLDNSADGTEHAKNFQRGMFFDLGLRVDPEFPWPLFVAVVGSLIGIYFAFYY